MVLRFLQLSFLIAPSIVAASPLSQARLPASLRSVIPSCALLCVESFLEEGFPACLASSDINCLCSRYSRSGFTLGEGVFSCVRSYCPGGTKSDYAPFYRLCSSQSGAVRPTHETLVVTTVVSNTPSPSPDRSPRITKDTVPFQVPVSQSSSRSEARNSQKTRSTLRSNPSGPSTTATSVTSPSARLSSTPRNLRSTPLPRSTTPTISSKASAPSEEPVLNNVQIIGLSAAGGACLLLVVCAIFLASFCRRARIRRERDIKAASFRGGPAVKSSNGPDRPRSDEYPQHWRVPDGLGIGVREKERRSVLQQLQTKWEQNGLHSENIGIAISPEAEKRASPPSAKSTRTLSVLLPDKPVPCYVKPLPQLRPESAMTESTFIEEGRACPDSGATSFVQASYSQHVATPTHRQPGPQHHAFHIPQQPARSATELESPMPQPPRTGSSHYSFGPVVPPQRDSNFSTRSDKDDYLPKYYTAIRYSSGGARVSSASRNRGSRSVRDSFASLTSFETADVDDPTPEDEEDKQLSPVPESPIASLRYPKIPRSSNQAVPRSPTAPSPSTPHQTTFPSRRRSEQAAREVEHMLWAMGSQPPPAGTSLLGNTREECSSAASSYIAVAFEGSGPHHLLPSHNQSQLSLADRQGTASNNDYTDQDDLQMKHIPNTAWQPTITPLRREDELFLTVS